MRVTQLAIVVVLFGFSCLTTQARPNFDHVHPVFAPHAGTSLIDAGQRLQRLERVVHANTVTDVDIDIKVTDEAPILNLDSTEPVFDVQCGDEEMRLLFHPAPSNYDLFHQTPFLVGGAEWNCQQDKTGSGSVFYRRVLSVAEEGEDYVLLKTRKAQFSELFTGRVFVEQREATHRERAVHQLALGTSEELDSEYEYLTDPESTRKSEADITTMLNDDEESERDVHPLFGFSVPPVSVPPLRQVVKDAGKAVKNTGNTIAKGAKDAAKAVNDGANKVVNDIKNALDGFLNNPVSKSASVTLNVNYDPIADEAIVKFPLSDLMPERKKKKANRTPSPTKRRTPAPTPRPTPAPTRAPVRFGTTPAPVSKGTPAPTRSPVSGSTPSSPPPTPAPTVKTTPAPTPAATQTSSPTGGATPPPTPALSFSAQMKANITAAKAACPAYVAAYAACGYTDELLENITLEQAVNNGCSQTCVQAAMEVVTGGDACVSILQGHLEFCAFDPFASLVMIATTSYSKTCSAYTAVLSTCGYNSTSIPTLTSAEKNTALACAPACTAAAVVAMKGLDTTSALYASCIEHAVTPHFTEPCGLSAQVVADFSLKLKFGQACTVSATVFASCGVNDDNIFTTGGDLLCAAECLAAFQEVESTPGCDWGYAAVAARCSGPTPAPTPQPPSRRLLQDGQPTMADIQVTMEANVKTCPAYADVHASCKLSTATTYDEAIALSCTAECLAAAEQAVVSASDACKGIYYAHGSQVCGKNYVALSSLLMKKSVLATCPSFSVYFETCEMTDAAISAWTTGEDAVAVSCTDSCKSASLTALAGATTETGAACVQWVSSSRELCGATSTAISAFHTKMSLYGTCPAYIDVYDNSCGLTNEFVLSSNAESLGTQACSKACLDAGQAASPSSAGCQAAYSGHAEACASFNAGGAPTTTPTTLAEFQGGMEAGKAACPAYAGVITACGLDTVTTLDQAVTVSCEASCLAAGEMATRDASAECQGVYAVHSSQCNIQTVGGGGGGGGSPASAPTSMKLPTTLAEFQAGLQAGKAACPAYGGVFTSCGLDTVTTLDQATTLSCQASCVAAGELASRDASASCKMVYETHSGQCSVQPGSGGGAGINTLAEFQDAVQEAEKSCPAYGPVFAACQINTATTMDQAIELSCSSTCLLTAETAMEGASDACQTHYYNHLVLFCGLAAPGGPFVTPSILAACPSYANTLTSCGVTVEEMPTAVTTAQGKAALCSDTCKTAGLNALYQSNIATGAACFSTVLAHAQFCGASTVAREIFTSKAGLYTSCPKYLEAYNGMCNMPDMFVLSVQSYEEFGARACATTCLGAARSVSSFSQGCREAYAIHKDFCSEMPAPPPSGAFIDTTLLVPGSYAVELATHLNNGVMACPSYEAAFTACGFNSDSIGSMTNASATAAACSNSCLFDAGLGMGVYLSSEETWDGCKAAFAGHAGLCGVSQAALEAFVYKIEKTYFCPQYLPVFASCGLSDEVILTSSLAEVQAKTCAAPCLQAAWVAAEAAYNDACGAIYFDHATTCGVSTFALEATANIVTMKRQCPPYGDALETCDIDSAYINAATSMASITPRLCADVCIGASKAAAIAGKNEQCGMSFGEHMKTCGFTDFGIEAFAQVVDQQANCPAMAGAMATCGITDRVLLEFTNTNQVYGVVCTPECLAAIAATSSSGSKCLEVSMQSQQMCKFKDNAVAVAISNQLNEFYGRCPSFRQAVQACGLTDDFLVGITSEAQYKIKACTSSCLAASLAASTSVDDECPVVFYEHITFCDVNDYVQGVIAWTKENTKKCPALASVSASCSLSGSALFSSVTNEQQQLERSCTTACLASMEANLQTTPECQYVYETTRQKCTLKDNELGLSIAQQNSDVALACPPYKNALRVCGFTDTFLSSIKKQSQADNLACTQVCIDASSEAKSAGASAVCDSIFQGHMASCDRLVADADAPNGLICSDCYFQFKGGFTFELSVQNAGQVETLNFILDGESKLKFQTMVTSEQSVDLTTLLLPEFGIPTPFGISIFGINVGLNIIASLSLGMQLDVTNLWVATSPFVKAFGTTQMGFRWSRSGGLRTVQTFDFEYSHSDKADFALSTLEGNDQAAKVKFTLTPSLQFNALDMVDVTTSLLPYITVDVTRPSNSTCHQKWRYATQQGMDFKIELSDLHFPNDAPLIGGTQIHDISADLVTQTIVQPRCILSANLCSGCVLPDPPPTPAPTARPAPGVVITVTVPGLCVKNNLECAGHGKCDLSRKTCECSSGWFGQLCDKDAVALEAEVAVRAKQAALLVAVQKAKQQAMLMCTGTKTVLCPDAAPVPTSMRNKCVSSRAACLGADVTASLTVARDNCTAQGGNFCGLVCADSGVSCGVAVAPLLKCPSGQMRCADGSCNTTCASSSSAVTCPQDQVPCGDGITCDTSKAACSRKVKYDGCGVGEVECEALPGTCAASQEECETKTGCPAGTRVCGVDRDANGVSKTSNGKAVFICLATCARIGKPQYKVSNIVPTVASNISVSDDTGFTALSISVGAGGLASAADSTATVKLTATPVADSDLNQGVMAQYHTGGLIMSPVVTVTPDTVVTVSDLKFDMPVNDEFALSSEANCLSVLAKLAAISSNNIETSAALRVDACAKGTASQCSCKFSVPHFTTFAVVDEDAATKVGISAAPSAVSGSLTLTIGNADEAPEESLGGGAIAGIIIGCLAAIGLIVFGVYKYNKSKSSPPQEPATASAFSASVVAEEEPEAAEEGAKGGDASDDEEAKKSDNGKGDKGKKGEV